MTQKSELLPCPCGNGWIETEVIVFVRWAVDRVLSPCLTCNSSDVARAREEAHRPLPSAESAPD